MQFFVINTVYKKSWESNRFPIYCKVFAAFTTHHTTAVPSAKALNTYERILYKTITLLLFSFENLAFNIEHNITVHVALTTIQLCIEMIKDSDRQHLVSALILIAYQSD